MTHNANVSLSSVRAAFPENAEVSAQRLHDWFAEADLPEELKAHEAVFQDVMREWALNGQELAWTPGGWRIKVKGQLVHASVVSAVAWTALTAIGVATASIPLVIVPMIAPYLFEVEKIELSKKEEALLTMLPLTDDVLDGSPNEIYDRLPADVQDQVNRLDFTEFLDRLAKAGVARETKGNYRVDKSDRKFLKITWG